MSQTLQIKYPVVVSQHDLQPLPGHQSRLKIRKPHHVQMAAHLKQAIPQWMSCNDIDICISYSTYILSMLIKGGCIN
eukprot:m.68234 g.68234  ORF g.68234 m.68234 type:complete len:77 (+) comp35500_c0_seq9:1254-1484(+)